MIIICVCNITLSVIGYDILSKVVLSTKLAKAWQYYEKKKKGSEIYAHQEAMMFLLGNHVAITFLDNHFVNFFFYT